MHVVRGKQLTPLTGDDLAALRAPFAHVVVDMGTGDGRAAYRLARARPDTLVVGVDPAWERMVETATRGARKPAKGGLPNILFVRGVAEDPPVELLGLADEVQVAMPWGRLLAGVVRGDPDVCGGLRALATTGATLEVTVGTDIWREPVPLEIRPLPELTVSYVDSFLRSALAATGWRVERAESLPASSAGTSWARRLSGGRPDSRFFQLAAVAG